MRAPTIRLVVFDLAGTTIEDDDAVNQAFRIALRSASVEADHDTVNAVMGLAKPEAITDILMKCRGEAPPALVDRVHARFVAAMAAHYRAGGVRPIDGAGEVMDALHAARVRVAIDTGFSRAIADAVMEQTGWLRDRRVDTVVASDDVPRGRPSPDMIFEAMRRLDIDSPRSVAKVGDTPSDLAEARRAECGLAIGVTYGTHDRAALTELPHDALIDSLPELLDVLDVGMRFRDGRSRRAPSPASGRTPPRDGR
jgi:phosphonatase-like hydrolase